jgi:hypothetical protein
VNERRGSFSDPLQAPDGMVQHFKSFPYPASPTPASHSASTARPCSTKRGGGCVSSPSAPTSVASQNSPELHREIISNIIIIPRVLPQAIEPCTARSLLSSSSLVEGSGEGVLVVPVYSIEAARV